MFGGDCHSYGLVASGFIDAVVEADLHVYDYLPVVPIVEGAGGRMTDWEGRELTLERDSSRVVAAAAGIHDACIDVLQT